jgi:hypothetical protein
LHGLSSITAFSTSSFANACQTDRMICKKQFRRIDARVPTLLSMDPRSSSQLPEVMITSQIS